MTNSFGTLFKITTFGESHGEGLGVCIDGCPAGLPLTAEEISAELAKRAPGQDPLTSPRKEPDQARIYSGLFEGKTTGTPLTILIDNKDADSSKYEPIHHLLRPGHANFTYLAKYGMFDYRGGGRASARETACRVAAGFVAKKILEQLDITIQAAVIEVGGSTKMRERIEEALDAQDSVGGIIEATATNVPPGLGEPLFGKLEALLAHAMLSLPASKGFEIGLGFEAARLLGSACNDLFTKEGEKIVTESNNAGGTLGGLSSGMPLVFRVAFKPPSSIGKSQKTLTTEGKEALFTLPKGSRHDPCVVFRAVPIVEAMTALVLVDLLLLNMRSKIEHLEKVYKG